MDTNNDALKQKLVEAGVILFGAIVDTQHKEHMYRTCVALNYYPTNEFYQRRVREINAMPFYKRWFYKWKLARS